MRPVMLVLTICLLLLSGCLGQGPDNYAVVGGGQGGPTDSPNFTVEGVKVVRSLGRDSLVGLGFTIIGSGGDADYDESTSDYQSLYEWEESIGTLTDEGVYRDFPEFGLFGKYGIEVVEDTGLFVTGFAGFTLADEVRVWQSSIPVYPYAYGEEEGWNVYGMYGGGLSYFFGGSTFLQVDFDNRRGTTVGFGWKF